MATNTSRHRLTKSKSNTRVKITIPSYEDLVAEVKGTKTPAQFMREGYRYVVEFAKLWDTDVRKAGRQVEILVQLGAAERVEAYVGGRRRKLYKLHV